MLLWGILGLVQSTLLPGLIILKVFRIRLGLIERIITIFVLSLLANYLVVFLLTALGIYNRTALVGLVFVEMLALMVLYRDEMHFSFSETAKKIGAALQEGSKPYLEMVPSGNDAGETLRFLLWFAFGCGAISAILWALHVWRLNIGTVFSGQDTLFSWNAYAEIWARNSIPRIHGAYPQMISANWSLSYVFQGKGYVQLFNTLLPPVFFLLIFVMLFDLGFQKKEAGFFIGAVIARYMMKKLLGDEIFNGYMDVPVAFMSFFVVYILLKGIDKDLAGRRQAVLLALLFASAAAVTKQIGFLILLLTPFLIAYWLPDGWKALDRKSKALIIFDAALIVLPWYVLCWVFSQSAGTPGEEFVAAGVLRFNQLYEWSHKFLLVRQTLEKYAVVFIVSLVGLPLIPKRYRLPFFLCSWPVALIWGAFFTYDARNLAAALPFIAVSAGFAVERIFISFADLLERFRFGKVNVWFPSALLIAAALAILWWLLPEERLVETQRKGQRELFGSQLNEEILYGQLGEEQHAQEILTDYPAYFLSGYDECCQMIDFSDSQVFAEKLTQPKVRYLLSPQNLQNKSEGSAAVLKACLQEGRCSLIACSSGYYEPYCLYTVE